MSKYNTKKSSTSKKKTRQGKGLYSKKTHSGGETFHGGARAGSAPSKTHRKKKPYRRQGK